MQNKTKAKLERKERKTWVGLYSRKTPTKAELIEKKLRKAKSKRYDNY